MSSTKRKKSFLNLFPVPEYLLLSDSGISMSDEGLHFVQFKRGIGKGKLEVSHCDEVQLDKTIELGEVVAKDKLLTALKELKDRHNILYTRATLPEEKAYLFTATIDKVPQESMRDAVAFIIEENVPLSLQESVFAYEVLGEAPKNKIKVAVAVILESIVRSYVELFEGAGITPVSFDIESQAVARAVIKKGDVGSYLIIRLSDRKTGLYVVEREVVQFSSTPAYGSGEGVGSPHMNDLRGEVRKLMAFWNTRLDEDGIPGKKIEKIIVSGSSAHKKDFVEELLKGIEVPYSFANVWVNTNFFEESVPEVPFDISLAYGAAVGLALMN